MRHFQQCIIIVVGLVSIVPSQISARPPKPVEGHVVVSYTMPESKDLRDATVKVTYRNVGSVDVMLRPPDKAPQYYRGLKVTLQGSYDIKYKVGGIKTSHVFAEEVIIEKGKEHSFSLRLDAVWKLPLNWKLVEFHVTDTHGPTGKNGPVKVDNQNERFVFIAENVKTPAGKNRIRFVRVFIPKVKVSIKIRKAVGSSDVVFTVGYTNTGKGPLTVLIPAKRDMPWYRGLRLIVDGKKVPYTTTLMYTPPRPSIRKQLAPGKSLSFDIPAKLIWTMPKKWKSLGVIQTGIYGPGNALAPAQIQYIYAPFRCDRSDIKATSQPMLQSKKKTDLDVYVPGVSDRTDSAVRIKDDPALCSAARKRTELMELK